MTDTSSTSSSISTILTTHQPHPSIIPQTIASLKQWHLKSLSHCTCSGSFQTPPNCSCNPLGTDRITAEANLHLPLFHLSVSIKNPQLNSIIYTLHLRGRLQSAIWTTLQRLHFENYINLPDAFEHDLCIASSSCGEAGLLHDLTMRFACWEKIVEYKATNPPDFCHPVAYHGGLKGRKGNWMTYFSDVLFYWLSVVLIRSINISSLEGGWEAGDAIDEWASIFAVLDRELESVFGKVDSQAYDRLKATMRRPLVKRLGKRIDIAGEGNGWFERLWGWGLPTRKGVKMGERKNGKGKERIVWVNYAEDEKLAAGFEERWRAVDAFIGGYFGEDLSKLEAGGMFPNTIEPEMRDKNKEEDENGID